MSLAQCWSKIKVHSPKTPEEFMHCVRLIKPDINDHIVVTWQRTKTVADWELQIFDFLWFYLQYEQGEAKWWTYLEQSWPEIRSTIETHSLQDLFKNMGI